MEAWAVVYCMCQDIGDYLELNCLQGIDSVIRITKTVEEVTSKCPLLLQLHQHELSKAGCARLVQAQAAPSLLPPDAYAPGTVTACRCKLQVTAVQALISSTKNLIAIC
jgi:hypothetical protein